MDILGVIGLVFGKLMYFIYNTIGFHNYALSLVLFTIVYKLILLPLSIKQMKSSAKMQELQPELARLQERYKHDREKLNEETMKFYQEKKYNPTGGCLPLLIQMPILIALFYVIRMPMSYMLDIPAKAVGEMTIASVKNGDLSYGTVGKETFDKISGDPIEVYKQFTKKDYYFEIHLMDTISKNPSLIDNNQSLSVDNKNVLKNFNLKMFNVFNFGIKPTLDINVIKKDPALYIPPLILLLIAVVTTYLSSMLMTPQTPTTKDGKNPAGCAGKGMLWISPIMTLWIGLQTPCGLSFYWLINNIFTFIQQKAMNKLFKKDKKEEISVANVNNKGSKNDR